MILIYLYLALLSILFAFDLHHSSFVFLIWLEVTTISTVNTFHLRQSSLVGHDEYCICLLHVSKIFCWPRSLLSMHLMCTIAGHDLHFTCLVYASKVFVRFICLQIAKFSIEYSFYMHHSSSVPFKYAFSWPRFPLYLPCICIIALLSNL